MYSLKKVIVFKIIDLFKAGNSDRKNRIKLV